MIRRTHPIRRTRLKVWRRPASDKVSPEQRAAVLERDGMCVLARLFPAEHVCRDQWGRQHSAYDLARLSIEHFWADGPTKGKRGPCTVAVCHYANEVSFEVSARREDLRDYWRTHVAPKAAEMDATA